MSSTTSDTEQSSKSGGPQGCVDRSRSAASSFLCDICRFVVLPCISDHAQHNGDMEVLGCLPVNQQIAFFSRSE